MIGALTVKLFNFWNTIYINFGTTAWILSLSLSGDSATNDVLLMLVSWKLVEFMSIPLWRMFSRFFHTTAYKKYENTFRATMAHMYSPPFQGWHVAYLLGLLAMIKCSICSYQYDNWYVLRPLGTINVTQFFFGGVTFEACFELAPMSFQFCTFAGTAWPTLQGI